MSGYTVQNTGLFATTQLYYAKSGNIVHVYFSGRTASELAANTVLTLTGLPHAAIQQDFGIMAAFGNRSIQAIVNQETANMTIVVGFPTNTWLRFNFSYISAM